MFISFFPSFLIFPFLLTNSKTFLGVKFEYCIVLFFVFFPQKDEFCKMLIFCNYIFAINGTSDIFSV